jgi:hypothetical protein
VWAVGGRRCVGRRSSVVAAACAHPIRETETGSGLRAHTDPLATSSHTHTPNDFLQCCEKASSLTNEGKGHCRAHTTEASAPPPDKSAATGALPNVAFADKSSSNLGHAPAAPSPQEDNHVDHARRRHRRHQQDAQRRNELRAHGIAVRLGLHEPPL